MNHLEQRAQRMQRAVAQGQSPVPSPCVGVCRLHAATQLCQGCWRTLDEIAQWTQLSDAQRLQVWSHGVQRSRAPRETVYEAD